MVAGQRIRKLSWSLAGAFLLCGFVCFSFAHAMAVVFSATSFPLTLPIRIVLWVGPFGWLALMVLLSVLFVLRDVRFRSSLLNLGVRLAIWIALSGAIVAEVCLAAVMLQPICVLGSNIV